MENVFISVQEKNFIILTLIFFSLIEIPLQIKALDISGTPLRKNQHNINEGIRDNLLEYFT